MYPPVQQPRSSFNFTYSEEGKERPVAHPMPQGYPPMHYGMPPPGAMPMQFYGPPPPHFGSPPNGPPPQQFSPILGGPPVDQFPPLGAEKTTQKDGRIQTEPPKKEAMPVVLMPSAVVAKARRLI
jgi:hypothetical protein